VTQSDSWWFTTLIMSEKYLDAYTKLTGEEIPE
jgi:hypothetical protein